MKIKFQKVKTEHHIIQDFAKLLLELEKHDAISRIIPWRIDRQQKSSSKMRFRITIPTMTWFKCIMSKWATAQELFIICTKGKTEEVMEWVWKFIIN